MKFRAAIYPILAVMLFMFYSVKVQAQYSVGLKAGMNLSTFSADDANAEYGFTPGYHIGGFADYSLEKMSFQLDVLYSHQGSSIESAGEDLKAVAKYVTIPLSFRYKITQSINLQAGPQIGFLTCLESDYHPITGEPFQKQDYTKAYKKTDFGINVGAGWESKKGLMIDLRYYLGLTDINDYPGIVSTKNSVLQLSVSYRIFRFGSLKNL
jgi:hypothetical protein